MNGLMQLLLGTTGLSPVLIPRGMILRAFHTSSPLENRGLYPLMGWRTFLELLGTFWWDKRNSKQQNVCLRRTEGPILQLQMLLEPTVT